MQYIFERYTLTETVSLDKQIVEGGGSMVDIIAAPDPPEDALHPDYPAEPVPLTEEHLLVKQALALLVPKERYVVEEIILAGKNLQEVAAAMCLSKSRIGQLLKSAKDNMRESMEKMASLDNA